MPRIGQRVRIAYLGEGRIVGVVPGRSHSEQNGWVWEPLWDVAMDATSPWPAPTPAPVPESDMVPLED